MDNEAYQNKIMEKVKLIQGAAQEALSVVATTKGLGSDEQEKLARGINSILEELKQLQVRLFSGGRQHCMARLVTIKNVLGKKITEIINVLVDLSEQNAENEWAKEGALQLEQSLNKLGIKLFSLPEGEKFDPIIDGLSAVVEHIDAASPEATLYVSKSHFGAKVTDGYGRDRIIQKARVEIADKPREAAGKALEGDSGNGVKEEENHNAPLYC